MNFFLNRARPWGTVNSVFRDGHRQDNSRKAKTIIWNMPKAFKFETPEIDSITICFTTIEIIRNKLMNWMRDKYLDVIVIKVWYYI